MDSKELVAINTLCDSTQETITLVFMSVGDEISESMLETLVPIVESAPCLALQKKRDSDEKEPFIKIRNNIKLKARPTEKIVYMLIDMIDASFHPEQHTKGYGLQELMAPVLLNVYIAPFCPHCPTVVKEMVTLALLSDQIQLEIIDGTVFTEKAKQNRIMAAPTVICDDKHRWSGTVSAREILDVICRRKPEDLSSDTLKSMVEAGNASVLAQMMIKEDMVFPAFYDLLVHEKWPVRLGAMVTVETIYEVNQLLTRTIIDTLWGHYDTVSNQVKGDMIYLIGQVGDESYRSRLEGMLKKGLAEDLRESVQEALESLNERLY